MKVLFKRIASWERIHIPNARKKKWYVFLKLVLLCIPLTIAWIGPLFTGRVNREDKPDIVFNNILSGFKHLAFPDEKTERLATKRANLCAICPAATKTGIYSVVIDNRTTNIQGMKCADCGCNLSAKIRSINDSCPRGRW
tara:strand:- start:585 stop:1004 length:420 start_codon:yes stop_codon:yes gene_type:complete